MNIVEAIAHYIRARRRLYATSSVSHPEFASAAEGYKTALENARAAGCSDAQLRHIELWEPAGSICPEAVVLR